MENSQAERLLDSVIEIKRDLDEVKQIVIRNTTVLEEHARRSTASEDRIVMIEDRLMPIEIDGKTRERMLTWGIGVLGALGTIFGIIDVIHNFL